VSTTNMMLCFQSPVSAPVEVAVPEPDIIQVRLPYLMALSWTLLDLG
jgi:hypothetical protein